MKRHRILTCFLSVATVCACGSTNREKPGSIHNATQQAIESLVANCSDAETLTCIESRIFYTNRPDVIRKLKNLYMSMILKNVDIKTGCVDKTLKRKHELSSLAT